MAVASDPGGLFIGPYNGARSASFARQLRGAAHGRADASVPLDESVPESLYINRHVELGNTRLLGALPL